MPSTIWAAPASLARIDAAMLALIAACYLAWDAPGQAMTVRTDPRAYADTPTSPSTGCAPR